MHPLSTQPNSLPVPASSSQVTLRHPETTIYRCFLSDLTGFIAFCRAGPGLQHRLTRVVQPDKSLKREFNPAVADCRFRAPLAPHLARPQGNPNLCMRLCQDFCLLTLLLLRLEREGVPNNLFWRMVTFHNLGGLSDVWAIHAASFCPGWH